MVDGARIVPVGPTFLRLLYITIVSRGFRVEKYEKWGWRTRL